MNKTTTSQAFLAEIDHLLPPTVVAALTDFQSHLLALFPDDIEQLILYGSYARGEAKPESDVDVLVVVNWAESAHLQHYYLGGPGDPRWQQIIDLAMDIMIARGPYISVLVVGQSLFNSNWSVAEAARKEGKVLWLKSLT